MSETAFILQNCTKAMAGAEESVYLLEQKSRLEQAVSSKDPGLTLDTSKALLESIFKTIISDRVAEPNLGQDLNPLYKNVRDVLVLNQDTQANEILKRLTNSIVHNVAELRNKYGAASHGDDGCYENPIQMPEAEMIAHLVDGMGGFLYRKHKSLGDPGLAQRIFYSDYSEFNDWLDTQNSPIKIPVEEAKEVPFSNFLFTYDVDIYRAMLLQYIQTEEDDEEAQAEVEFEAQQAYEETQEYAQSEAQEAFEENQAEAQAEAEFEAQQAYEEAQEYAQSEAQEAHVENNKVKWVAGSLKIGQSFIKNLSDFNFHEPIVSKNLLQHVVAVVINFIKVEGAVDWFDRESQLSKLKLLIRRELKRVHYPRESLDVASEVLSNSLAVYYREKNKREELGE